MVRQYESLEVTLPLVVHMVWKVTLHRINNVFMALWYQSEKDYNGKGKTMTNLEPIGSNICISIEEPR